MTNLRRRSQGKPIPVLQKTYYQYRNFEVLNCEIEGSPWTIKTNQGGYIPVYPKVTFQCERRQCKHYSDNSNKYGDWEEYIMSNKIANNGQRSHGSEGVGKGYYHVEYSQPSYYQYFDGTINVYGENGAMLYFPFPKELKVFDSDSTATEFSMQVTLKLQYANQYYGSLSYIDTSVVIKVSLNKPNPNNWNDGTLTMEVVSF